MYPAKMTSEQVIQYYDLCQTDYELVWHLKSKMAMHYGYWDANTYSLKDALVNMNKYLASQLNVQASDYILDAGCGVGGSSIYLAGQHGCRTMGISLSEKQIQTCRQNAKRYHTEDRCRFEVKDYTRTGFAGGEFDGAWAVESVCHANVKKEFLQETYRLLKPGGRLVIADFFTLNGNSSPGGQQLLQRWAESWAVPFFEREDRFEQDMADCGFTRIKKTNITEAIRPSARRLYYYFFPGWIVGNFLKLTRQRSEVLQKNLWSSYYQYQALKNNLWNYFVFTASKPF